MMPAMVKCPTILVRMESPLLFLVSVNPASTAGHKIEATLGFRLVLIPGTSHCPYWEQPEKFNTLLLDSSILPD